MFYFKEREKWKAVQRPAGGCRHGLGGIDMGEVGSAFGAPPSLVLRDQCHHPVGSSGQSKEPMKVFLNHRMKSVGLVRFDLLRT